MQFNLDTAQLFVPDGVAEDQALRRTTHMIVSAHQDDIEIMAARPILECFQDPDHWPLAVVMTDGRGSPRNGIYARYSDEQMRAVRSLEQRKAAVVGEYTALALLDYPSRAIKDGADRAPVEDLVRLLSVARPKAVYTHNLADKHDTHVATALRVIAALRSLPEADRPQKLYGCEVWRDLDWMVDEDKVAFDLSGHENLQAALLGVFDSQIVGGKRYDLASLGRRRANATYFESHGVDQTTGLSFAMDLTPLIEAGEREILPFVNEQIQRFAQDVSSRLARLNG